MSEAKKLYSKQFLYNILKKYFSIKTTFAIDF